MRAAPYCPGKDATLIRKIHAGAVDQVDDGDALPHRDFLRAQDLPDGLRPPRAGLDRGVVGDDHDFSSLHDTHAGDDPGAGRLAVILIVGDQQTELEPGRAGIEETLDPLSGRELALLVHLGDARGSAALPGAGRPGAGTPRSGLSRALGAGATHSSRRTGTWLPQGERCSAAHDSMYSIRSVVGVPGPKRRPMPSRWSAPMSSGGMIPPPVTSTSGRPMDSRRCAHPGEERHVRAGENREAHDIHVFLHRRGGDHLRRLVQAGVDHLHAGVAQRGGHDLGAAVVSVEPGLGDEHTDRARQRAGWWSYHLNRSRAARPRTDARASLFVDHVDDDPLTERLLDRVVHDIENRNGVAFAAAFALGPCQAARVAAAESRLGGVGIDEQGAHLTHGQRAERLIEPVDGPAAPSLSSISCTSVRSEARSHCSRTASVAAWTIGAEASFGLSLAVPSTRSTR